MQQKVNAKLTQGWLRIEVVRGGLAMQGHEHHREGN